MGAVLPETITAGGRTRLVTRHLRNDPHEEIDTKRVEHVLENWLVRGIRREPDGRLSWSYLAFVHGLEEMVRVVVSMDDERIITAFPDRTATRHWNGGNRDYFARTYLILEERNAS